jgi:hypothetical protein
MMAAMARNREADQHGELIVAKHGVYMVLGDKKLKSIRLVPWEQFLASDELRAGSPIAEQAQDRPRHMK